MKLSDKFKGYIAGAFLAFLISGLLVLVADKLEPEDEIDWEMRYKIEKDITSDSQYNFQVIRDLFTPMYNDSVTIENVGYDDGWIFWVNHSQVLNSYYFENMKCYKVRFPTFGKIELWL